MAILIVDDDKTIRFMLERLLNKAGYEDLYFASSPKETFKLLGIDDNGQKENTDFKIDSSNIELILMDIMMPDIDGIEACERLKRHHDLSNIPIIMVTALTETETLEKAFNAGAIDYITKPVRKLELLARVDSAVKLNRERQTRLKRERELEDALKSLEEMNAKLEKLATIDELTQIPNRRLFDETLNNEWKRAKRDKTPLSLIILDIDYFKKYNDTYGHQQGDKCLKVISSRLSELILRPGDFAARYGGEEFAVILPNTQSDDSLMVAKRIREGIEGLNIPHVASRISDNVTISLGVTCVDFDEVDYQKIEREDVLNSFINSADKALYEAKENGRNTAKFKSF
ncbi:diguanylate cyclase [Natranaerobius trueperi]|uniref:Stage 0 sporulation protein A homolog n=1 Tax=Natranaerobius trueperi TaxID=759412 RepID=A0A226C303_9FIRM|nr:diguanylate cyclase [Natranaerobius trueperi]OWZ84829.1 diguanylate cyclase response regulator [Natranaerobius trueperi]